MRKLANAITLGLGGLAIVSVGVAHGQLGDLGEAAKKGATEAVMKDVAGRAGLASPTVAATPALSPAASPSTVLSPTSVATASSPTPTSTATPVTIEGAGRMLMEEAGKKGAEEAGKRMMPKVP